MGYSTKRKPHSTWAGYGVACDSDRHLGLDSDAAGLQDKIPYATPAAAKVRLDLIERLGFCRGTHRIVEVWHSASGARPKKG